MQPKKPWAHANGSEYINRNNKRFSRIHKSMIFYLEISKFAVEVPSYKWRLHTKIKVNRASLFRDMKDLCFFFPSSFCTNYKIGSHSQVYTPIRLKFGTLVWCIKANSGTNFNDNTAKLHGDTNVYSRIQRYLFIYL